MEESPPSDIYDLADECDKKFVKLSEKDGTDGIDVIRVLHDRFSQWADHLGVFALDFGRPKVSLDSRLRYSESLRSIVLRYLGSIEEILDDVESLGDVNSDDSRDESPEFSVEQMQWSAEDELSSSLAENLQALESAVESLYRLGIAIRQSSSGNITQRINAFMDKQNDGMLENMVYFHLKYSLVDSIRMNATRTSTSDSPGAALSLCRQLAMSITFRYFGILYTRDHADKIGANQGPKLKRQEPGRARATEANSAITPNRHQTSAQRPSAIPPHVRANAPRSDTEPSIPDTERVRQAFALSRQRHENVPPSVISIRPTQAKYPDQPKIESKARDFDCPYCRQKFPRAKLENRAWWERHVDTDFRLYACISEECADPPQLFARFDEWRKHMDVEHTPEWTQRIHRPVSWYCDRTHEEPLSFTEEAEFDEHVKREHTEHADGPEFEMFKDWCEVRRKRQPNVCPVCNCIPDKIEIITRGHTAGQGLVSNPASSRSGPSQSEIREKLISHIADHVKRAGFLSMNYIEDYDQGGEQGSGTTSGGAGENREPLDDGTWIDCDWEAVNAEAVSFREIQGPDVPPDPEFLSYKEEWQFVYERLPSRMIHSSFTPDFESINITSVRQRLWASFQPSKNLKEDVDSVFLPRKALTAILTGMTIQLLLRENLETTEIDLVDITGPQKRIEIFAILLSDERTQHLGHLVKQGITDDDLPLTLKILQTCLGDEDNTIGAFLDSQYEIHVPVWNFSAHEVQEAVYSRRQRLPILSKTPLARGGQGVVWKVKIHPDHYQTKAHSDCWERLQKGPEFALKEFSARNEFIVELEALKRFSQHDTQHEHLIKVLAAYSQGSNHFLIFPLAEGNLDRFWREPSPSFRDPLWLLTQCHGLTEGLDRIHQYRVKDSSSKHKRLFGRHGDIKPTNILWFLDPSTGKDRLVLADFTLMRFHPEGDFGTTDSIGATRTYRAPEMTFTAGQRLSQDSDIWNLGCVFLEFVSCHLVGYDATLAQSFQGHDGTYYQSFTTVRLMEEHDETHFREDKYFYYGPSQEAEVKSSVRNWVLYLHEQQNCSDAMHDFLDVIQVNMLKPNPESRWSVRRVLERLAEILAQSGQDGVATDYCSMGRPRVPGRPDRFPPLWNEEEYSRSLYTHLNSQPSPQANLTSSRSSNGSDRQSVTDAIGPQHTLQQIEDIFAKEFMPSQSSGPKHTGSPASATGSMQRSDDDMLQYVPGKDNATFKSVSLQSDEGQGMVIKDEPISDALRENDLVEIDAEGVEFMFNFSDADRSAAQKLQSEVVKTIKQNGRMVYLVGQATAQWWLSPEMQWRRMAAAHRGLESIPEGDEEG